MEGPTPNFQTTPPQLSSPGTNRFLGFIRRLTVTGFFLAGVAFTADAFLPAHLKPSTLIGTFHGSIDTAEIDAKIDAQVELARRQAEAQAVEQARAQMETEAFRVQQERLTRSLEAQTITANVADFACIAGSIASMFDGWQDVGNAASQACGISDQIRRGMTGTLVEGGQTGSTVMQRVAQPAPVEPVIQYIPAN